MPLKITHVVRALETGGLETLVLDASARLRRVEGVDASVLALFPGDGLEGRPEYRGVPCSVLDGQRKSNLAIVLELARFFQRELPDVVHLHNFLAQVYAGMAARLAGVPAIIATKHGSEWPRLACSRWLAGRAYRLADIVVAVSPGVQQGFLRTYGFPAARTRLILNGIDTDRFRPMDGDQEEARQRVLGFAGSPLVGTVSRLSEEKGIPALLKAFRTVLERAADARLVVAGDGPDRLACQQEARRLGVAGRVRFLGNRDDVAAIYPLLDVYVQPSYTEGISLTLLEACSCGLPVVATNVGGNPEIVLDGTTGLLVPPRDPEALAGAVVELWQGTERGHEMGPAARQRVVERFSIGRMVQEYVGLYGEVRDGRARRGRHRRAGEQRMASGSDSGDALQP